MEKFQEMRIKAKKHLTIADHILTQTYPIVQDCKLLLLVLENIFLGFTNSMGAILYYERLFKRIPPFQNTFESKFKMFKAKIVNRYKLDMRYVDIIREIKESILQHKRSPVEFRRKDKFVICTNDYHVKTISVNDIKEYIKYAREFFDISVSITRKNQEIFT